MVESQAILLISQHPKMSLFHHFRAKVRKYFLRRPLAHFYERRFITIQKVEIAVFAIHIIFYEIRAHKSKLKTHELILRIAFHNSSFTAIHIFICPYFFENNN